MPETTQLRSLRSVGRREALEELLPLVDGGPSVLGADVHPKFAEILEVGAGTLEHDRLRLHRRRSS